MHGKGFVKLPFKSDFFFFFISFLFCLTLCVEIIGKGQRTILFNLMCKNLKFLKYQTGAAKCISNSDTDFTDSCTSIVKSTNATISLSPVLISFIVFAKLNSNERLRISVVWDTDFYFVTDLIWRFSFYMFLICGLCSIT